MAEHPDLWAQYGADAVAFAGAALETLDAYANDLSGPRGHPTLSYYKAPRTCRTLLTEPRCQAAYDAAGRGEGPDGWAINEDPPALGLLKQWKRSCNTGRQVANCPVAHNQEHALLMAMTEAWSAVDSAFYSARIPRNPLRKQQRGRVAMMRS